MKKNVNGNISMKRNMGINLYINMNEYKHVCKKEYGYKCEYKMISVWMNR